MARFIFKLQAVLRQRRIIEDQRKKALADLLRQRVGLENELRDMQTAIRDDKSRMTGALIGRVDVRRIRQHASHVAQTTARAHTIVLRLSGLHHQIDHARAALLRAARDRKAIELLRDRQHRRWLAEQNRREAAALDELATQTHGRKLQEVER
jgi:flagellar FliJ protein